MATNTRNGNTETDPVSTSHAIADYLLFSAREQGEALTHLKLQKLLYYAQAWHLALYDRELFVEDFEAWVHGPVLPSVYARFRDASWQPITEEVAKPEIPAAVAQHLNEILAVFGSESAIALEQMTHAEEPWLEARGDLPPDATSHKKISKDTMRRFYRALQQQG